MDCTDLPIQGLVGLVAGLLTWKLIPLIVGRARRSAEIKGVDELVVSNGKRTAKLYKQKGKAEAIAKAQAEGQRDQTADEALARLKQAGDDFDRRGR